ncbi:hypothetical protein RI129_007731 [Pyrocoelia pectoralis]|uniref:Melanin-concentrating hormone n=1 Tax=Pyrocoelia pectoralis TaxID=417401 RepID=A0AAN7VE49_9COLE
MVSFHTLTCSCFLLNLFPLVLLAPAFTNLDDLETTDTVFSITNSVINMDHVAHQSEHQVLNDPKGESIHALSKDSFRSIQYASPLVVVVTDCKSNHERIGGECRPVYY